MAHENFEDNAMAGLMNNLFVNIKVGREEHPNIDHIYMNALHMLGEQDSTHGDLNSLNLIFPVLVECL